MGRIWTTGSLYDLARQMLGTCLIWTTEMGWNVTKKYDVIRNCDVSGQNET